MLRTTSDRDRHLRPAASQDTRLSSQAAARTRSSVTSASTRAACSSSDASKRRRRGGRVVQSGVLATRGSSAANQAGFADCRSAIAEQKRGSRGSAHSCSSSQAAARTRPLATSASTGRACWSADVSKRRRRGGQSAAFASRASRPANRLDLVDCRIPIDEQQRGTGVSAHTRSSSRPALSVQTRALPGGTRSIGAAPNTAGLPIERNHSPDDRLPATRSVLLVAVG
jgi:hypothetical protein